MCKYVYVDLEVVRNAGANYFPTQQQPFVKTLKITNEPHKNVIITV